MRCPGKDCSRVASELSRVRRKLVNENCSLQATQVGQFPVNRTACTLASGGGIRGGLSEANHQDLTWGVKMQVLSAAAPRCLQAMVDLSRFSVPV